MNRDLALSNADGSWELGHPLPAGTAAEPRWSYGPTLDFAALLRIIREWRWLVLGCIAAGLVLAIVLSLLTTPLYRARVTLEVNPPTVEIMDDEASAQPSPVNIWDFVATQVGLLKSRSLAERVAEELNLANNPEFVDESADPAARLKAAAAQVASGLRVEAPEEGQLIEFSYVSESPELAAQIANAYAEAFINTNLQRRYEASAYARNFLERQIAKTRADLEKSERQLVQYAQAQGIINTGSGEAGVASDAASPQGESLLALNKALAEATARRVAAEGAYRAAQSSGITSEETASTQALRQSRAALEAEYQQKRTLMKPDHPDMLSIRSRIDELDRQIARETSNVASGRINGLQADYRAALAAERALQARVSQLKGEVLDLRGRSIRYTILQREVDTNRALYDALLQRYKQIGVAGGVGVAPVSIVDRAEVPRIPVKPNLFLNLLLGFGFGLVAGIAAAIGIEFINDTIKSREDVRKKLSLACLGAVPRTRAKETFVEELKNPTSVISEAYSAIVAALRFSTESGMPKVLLLTSTRSGEGKSSSALALAQNFARRGKSVLLIDADLRKPAFKAGNDATGLSKLLTTDDRVDDHLVETQHANLWLLPSGPVPPSPADLLSTGRIRKVIAEASERFELVVIDGPPTLGLADAPLLAAAAGEVVFVIESASTRTRAAVEALNRLEATGTHIIGAVLTKAADGGSAYSYGRYGYGYGYGSGYGSTNKVKRTDILMIARPEDESEERASEESEA